VLGIGMVSIGAALAEEKPTPAARLKAIQTEVADAEAAVRAAWEKLQDDPQVDKLAKVHSEKVRAGMAAAYEIAKADPTSDVGFAALEWLLLTPSAYYLPSGKPAIELMRDHHTGNPKIGKSIAVLAYYPLLDTQGDVDPVTIALFRAVAEKNLDRTIRGQAVLGLAWVAKREFLLVELKADADADRLASAAEQAFERVVREYGDCPNLRSRGARPATTTLGEEANTELFELRNLRIGKPAPNIAAEDLAGTSFKLSDYRGKVVLLVFWASWCGPCVAEVPHERELVGHFKDRPFALIGVNGDETKEMARKAVAKYQIPWRSFWNGKQGAGGPIAVSWNVRGWPTVYVIDHRGMIRHKYLRGKRLDEPLEKLVAEAEAAGKEKDGKQAK
jgi:peroxiredoxin